MADDAETGQAALAAAHRQYTATFAVPFAAHAPAAAQRIECRLRGGRTRPGRRRPGGDGRGQGDYLDGCPGWGVPSTAGGGEMVGLRRRSAGCRCASSARPPRFVRPTAPMRPSRLKQYGSRGGGRKSTSCRQSTPTCSTPIKSGWRRMQDVAAGDARGFRHGAARRQAQAQGYFALLAPTYAEQRGTASAADVAGELAAIVARGGQPVNPR